MPTSASRFVRFRVWRVVVPARPEIIQAPPPAAGTYQRNLSWPSRPIHLIEGETDDGLLAVGESHRAESRETVETTLRWLLGRDLASFSPPTAWMGSEVSTELPAPYPLLSAESRHDKSTWILETLWLDAVGKRAGLPAHALLGGAVRDRVPVDFWANRPTVLGFPAFFAEALSLGLKGLKVKSDASGDTVHALQEIAREIPAGFRLTIDPMCAWRNFAQARPLLEILESLPARVQVEDPFPHDAYAEWHRARSAFRLPFIYHARDAGMLTGGLREGVADAFNLGRRSAYEFVRMAAVVQFAGKDCWNGGPTPLGVIEQARLHAAASAPNCVLASDLHCAWVRQHSLVTPALTYEDGCAVVPQRPGLGVSLDHEAMANFCQERFEVA